METLQSDVLEAVNRSKDFVRTNIRHYAEQSAEIYVSSKLGLDDTDERKRNLKNVYIEEFTNLMYKNLY